MIPDLLFQSIVPVLRHVEYSALFTMPYVTHAIAKLYGDRGWRMLSQFHPTRHLLQTFLLIKDLHKGNMLFFNHADCGSYLRIKQLFCVLEVKRKSHFSLDHLTFSECFYILSPFSKFLNLAISIQKPLTSKRLYICNVYNLMSLGSSPHCEAIAPSRMETYQSLSKVSSHPLYYNNYFCGMNPQRKIHPFSKF